MMKKGKVFGKSQIAVTVMVLALAAAVWLNMKYTPTSGKYLGEASYVSGSSTVVPDGETTSRSAYSPAVVPAGIVTVTDVAPSATVTSPRSTPSAAVSSAGTSDTAALVFAGEPSDVRFSPLTSTDVVPPAVTVGGRASTTVRLRANDGVSGEFARM